VNRMRALMIKSSHKLGRPIVNAATWVRTIRTTPEIALDTVRRRLELLLTATYGVRFEIAPVADDTPRNTFHMGRRRPIARHDGVSIKLPATMDASDGTHAAIARYRLLAIEQAVRIIRGSAALAPTGNAVTRDLYNLREGAEIDASIAISAPGVAPLIAEERARAIAARPNLSGLSAREQAVEQLVRTVLKSDPAVVPEDVRAGESPEDSLAWARTRTRDVELLTGQYRALKPIAVWGQTLDAADPGAARGPQYGALVPPSPGYGSGESAAPSAGADDTLQELTPTGDDAARLPDNAANQDDPDHALALDDASTRGDPDPDPEGAGARRTGALNVTDAAIFEASRSGDGILYPEWDCNASAYRELGAIVHAQRAPQGDVAWADRVLGEHPALVRRTRREFERLRARRMRMLRQREGDELDLAACVRALADATAGDSSDDRLYMSVRAARRAIAITILIDVSASTKDVVADGRSVIDIEKTTLLIASEAFDALGDSYSILTFSGTGAADVRVATLKAFSESNSDAVRRRIAAIDAGGNTRLGAAIRHATAILASQPAGHRLLLILSDGKPNDVDRYFTTYAVEDSRQAIFDARAEGIYPFCLTIDASDRDPYLARVFGAAGHTILRNPEHLPVALLDLVRDLLRGGGR
jgi:nitric oxide reductase NorD protein